MGVSLPWVIQKLSYEKNSFNCLNCALSAIRVVVSQSNFGLTKLQNSSVIRYSPRAIFKSFGRRLTKRRLLRLIDNSLFSPYRALSPSPAQVRARARSEALIRSLVQLTQPIHEFLGSRFKRRVLRRFWMYSFRRRLLGWLLRAS